MDAFFENLKTALSLVVNGPRNIDFDYFVYSFPLFSAIAVGGSQTQQVPIQADADFECHEFVMFADQAGAQTTFNSAIFPNMTAIVTDTGSGRRLSDNPVPLIALCSTGLLRRELPGGPRTFVRNGVVQLTLTNNDAAVANLNVRIAMVGRKVFML